jgi:hypothetical protein
LALVKDLLVVAVVQRPLGAGQEVGEGDVAEAQAKEVEQGRLGRHPRQGRIVAHHEHMPRPHLGQQR